MYQEQISQWVEAHREEMLEDIKSLVRIRSDKGEAESGKPFGPGPDAALRKMLALAESYGFHTRNYEGYAGTADLLEDNDHQLDILTHLDCVPVADGWTVTEPFVPVVKDGKLYGRGAADDKGPAVAALYAARCVKELGLPVSHNVRLVWGCDEECGSSDLRYYYGKEPEAEYTFSPDADFPVIHVEKGGFAGNITAKFEQAAGLPRVESMDAGLKINVVPDRCRTVIAGMRKTVAEIYCAAVTEKTGVRFRITEDGKERISIEAQGTGAHAAMPEGGNNAITASLALVASMHLAACPQFETLCALSQLLPHGDYLGRGLGVAMEDEVSGELTLSLNILHVTGTELSAQFDSRTPVCATEENMKQVAAKNCAARGLRLEDTPMRPPHYVPADSRLVKTLMECYRDHTGDRDAKPLSMGGGTYCHDLKNGVAFGCTMPGTDNRMHGNDEFAVVEELVTSVKIFADAIIRLCG